MSHRWAVFIYFSYQCYRLITRSARQCWNTPYSVYSRSRQVRTYEATHRCARGFTRTRTTLVSGQTGLARIGGGVSSTATTTATIYYYHYTSFHSYAHTHLYGIQNIRSLEFYCKSAQTPPGTRTRGQKRKKQNDFSINMTIFKQRVCGCLLYKYSWIIIYKLINRILHFRDETFNSDFIQECRFLPYFFQHIPLHMRIKYANILYIFL